METTLAFIVVFGSLVFFHELGHFLFAKKAGIMVREFAIGFGPKIIGITKGETLYTVRLLPLGGYVQMAIEFTLYHKIKTQSPFRRDKRKTNRSKVLLNGSHLTIVYNFPNDKKDALK